MCQCFMEGGSLSNENRYLPGVISKQSVQFVSSGNVSKMREERINLELFIDRETVLFKIWIPGLSILENMRKALWKDIRMFHMT